MSQGMEHPAIIEEFVTPDRRELLSHGSSEFSMSVHRTLVVAGVHLALYYHWHEELEVFILTKGRVRLFIGEREYHLKAGDIAVISPGLPHMAYREGEEEIEFYAIVVQMKFLGSQTNDLIHNQYILPTFLGWKRFQEYISMEHEDYESIRVQIMTILEMYQLQNPGYELMIKGCLYQILYYLSKENDYNGNDKEIYDYQWVRKILTYVQENYQSKIILKELADYVNLSEGYFCRSMKKVFHVSPMEFINRYRISQAVILIENTEKKLGDIAFEVGFSSVNRFTDSFKKMMSCNPMEYRMQLRKMKKDK